MIALVLSTLSFFLFSSVSIGASTTFPICPGGDSRFNPKTQICCSGKVHHRFSWYQGCCDQATFDPNYAKCCNGAVFQDKNACCSGVGYRMNEDACCGGKVFEGVVRCCGDVGINAHTHSCCAGTAYNRSSQICCQGSVQSKRFIGFTTCCGQRSISTPQRCCHGKKVYDNVHQRCENGEVVDKEVELATCGQSIKYPYRRDVCCKGKVFENMNSCCNGVGYHSGTAVCCDGIVYEGYQRCCNAVPYPNGVHGCCGRKLYKLGPNLCCQDTINEVPSIAHRCIRNSTYDINRDVICKGKRFQLARWCCGGHGYLHGKKVCCGDKLFHFPHHC